MKNLPRLPDRRTDANKGDFGHVLLVGGSRGMAGSISISALGALHSGAGLTTVATAYSSLNIVANAHPALMTIPLAQDNRGRINGSAIAKINSLLLRSTVAGIGPGMGQSLGLKILVWQLYQFAPLPMVFDADALNAIAKCEDWASVKPVAARILTPHPGEWHRLSGIEADKRDEQIEAAKQVVSNTGVVIVLKGSKTFIVGPDQSAINETGNAKLAVGGSGDLLTGIITSLLGQGMSTFDAARLGAYLHGLAGDLAAEATASPSVLPTQVIEYLPAAFAKLK